MNYSLTIKAQLAGSSLGEVNRVTELIHSLDGVTLEECSIKPVDTMTVVVDRGRQKGRKFSNDPRMVYMTIPRPNGTATKGINIPATLANLKLSEDQVLNGSWRIGSVEFRVQQAIKRRKK